MPDFYYSDCDTYNSDYGIPIDCRDHEEGTQIVEGQCHSGSAHDCHGDANQVACCSGHYQGWHYKLFLKKTDLFHMWTWQ